MFSHINRDEELNIGKILIIELTFFLWLMVGQNVINGQESYNSRTYTRDDGLPYNYVLDIIRDQTGFMWISTWDGLSRFDGYEFKNYHHIPGDSTSIPFFVINKVLVDELNNVWVLCASRPLMRYNRAKDNFERVSYKGIRDSVEKHILPSFDKKSLWFFIPIDRKLYKYSVENQQFKSIEVTGENGIDMSNFWNSFPYIVADNKGVFWWFNKFSDGYTIKKGIWENDSTLNIVQLNPLNVTSYKPSSNISRNDYFDIYVSRSGTTWLFSNYGIFSMDPKDSRFKKLTGTIHPEEFRGKPYCYWFDDDGYAHFIDPENNTYLKIPPPGGGIFQTVYVDPTGAIWYGSLTESRGNMGLTRVTRTPTYFNHCLNNTDDQGNPYPVFSVIKDKNCDIWAATRGLGYLFRIKPDGKVIKVKLPFPFPGKELPRVRSIISDSAGIWLGCTGDMIYHYNFKTEKFRYWKLSLKDSSGVEKNLGIHNILLEKNELIISGNGVFRFNPVTNALQQKYYNPDSPDFTFVSDDYKGYWAGIYRNSVIRFDPDLNATGTFRIGRDLDLIEHICPGDSNDIWIAIMGGGLGHLYPQTGATEAYTTADGLSNNTTYSILKDEKGNLWVSTNQGISRFNQGTKQFRNFGKDEGLRIEEFNSDACYKASDGQMFLGGIGGFVSFYPDSIIDTSPTSEAARLVITDFRVSGKMRIFEKAVYDKNNLLLQKGDNNFQISFACLNLNYADKIIYRYRLKGGNDWTLTDHRSRQISYTNLSPGNYELQIEATNSEGNWASHTDLNIRIPFRYYETWWFKIIIGLFFAGFIIIIVLIYIRQIRLKATQKQDELTMESIRAQMNPHFIFNSLNSINYFILSNDRFSANNYIADFSRLILSILNNMKQNYIPFDQELQFINDYLKLEHLRFRDKFNYTVKEDLGEDKDQILIMPGMVQSFIENAIWHGIRNLEERTGTLKVSFVLSEEKGYIKCYIEDNGVGRKLSSSYKNDLPGKKSRGIGIVSERLRLINKIRKTNYEIVIEDLYPLEEETGTRVIVDIPIKI